jgi:hypothetical protein
LDFDCFEVLRVPTAKAWAYASTLFVPFWVRGSIMFPERAAAQGSRLVLHSCRGTSLERRRIFFTVFLRVLGFSGLDGKPFCT